MKNLVRREVTQLFEAQKQESRPHIVSEADLEGLPEPVRRYLRYTQIIGKERIRAVRLKQAGFMRTNQDQKWMPAKAEQYYTVDPPAFIWYGIVKFLPLLGIVGRDKFHEGKGHMLIKLLSLFTVVDAKGLEIDQGALVRYFSEIIWFPTAYLSDFISWEPIDAKSARGTIKIHGMAASAVFHFNDDGQLTNFVAKRYWSADGEYVLETWSTPILEYAEINGIMVPVKGEAVWNLSSGDFSYFKVEITDIEYNQPVSY